MEPQTLVAFTDRQLQVIHLLARGGNNVTIGAELGVAPRTVIAHCNEIRRRLGCGSRREIVSAYRAATGIDPWEEKK